MSMKPAGSNPQKSGGFASLAAKPMPTSDSGGFAVIKLLKSNPLSFYTGNQARHGDYVRIKTLPGFDFYTLTHPTAVEHVLQTHQKNFHKPDVFLKPSRLLFGNGIFTSEGDYWMKQRLL